MVDNLGDDLLQGVGPISAYMGMSTRRLYYLAETRQLPVFKVGNRWCALKSVLRKHFESLSKPAPPEH